MHFFLLPFVLALTGVPGGPRETVGWTKVYELSVPGAWFAAVRVTRDGGWVAGGKNTLVDQQGGPVRARKLAGRTAMGFGEDSGGHLLSVGSGGAVWEHRAGEWLLVHPIDGKDGKGRDGNRTLESARGSDRHLLYDVGYIDPVAPDQIVAYGPGSSLVARTVDGHWQAREDRALSHRALAGPELDLPPGCRRMHWRWFAKDEGFLTCHDRRAFLFTDGVAHPWGRAPKTCDELWTTTRLGTAIFANCGVAGQVWRATPESWTPVPGLRRVRAIHGRDTCLMAVTDRVVWRRCEK